MLFGCVVDVTDEIAHRSVVGEGNERVSEPFGDVYCATVDVVEQHGIPLAERRRSNPDVDHKVEHCSTGCSHILRLPFREISKMHTTQYSTLRNGSVGLAEIEWVSDRFAQFVESIPLKKNAALV